MTPPRTKPATGRGRICPGSRPHCLRISDAAFEALRTYGLGSASAGLMLLYKQHLQPKETLR